MTPDELLAAWHAQQTAFIEMRDLRTRTVVDVLASLRAERGRPLRVLDVACGPGSLGTALLDRLPDTTVVGIDRDPILLRLGRETNAFGERLTFADRDLTSDDWGDGLGLFDAAMSATALHWLQPGELATMYLRLAEHLHPGGVFLNADHLHVDATVHPTLHALSRQTRADFERDSFATGVHTWDQWWDEALRMPGWEPDAELWRARWADKQRTVKVDVGFHLSSLRAAGFVEVGQVFQWFDDRIVYGRLPADWSGRLPEDG